MIFGPRRTDVNTKTLSPLFPAVALAVGVALGVPAHASLIDCDSPTLDTDISGRVTPSIGCQILEPISGPNSNVNDSLSLINEEMYFGHDDWLFDGKWEDPTPSGADALLPLIPDPDAPATLIDFDGDAQSGNWTLLNNSLWDLYSDLMFIFKDGANTNLVGYLMEVGATEGSYDSPFISPPFEFQGSGPRDISHISIYMRENGVQIPAPGVLGLFGLGLLGLGWTLRRRRSDC